MNEKPNQDASTEAGRKLRFHFIKSCFFRVIHVDGAHGGITPNGNIQMAVFNDRLPIPQLSVHELLDAGQPDTDQKMIGQEIIGERVTRDGVVREVEAELIMDITTAKKLHQWLQERIEILEKIKAGQP